MKPAIQKTTKFVVVLEGGDLGGKGPETITF